MDIAAWLRGLGLEQYTSPFQDNAVDGEVLRELTADDLKELGVTPVGHRRKLLSAIAALEGEPPASTPSARSAFAPVPNLGAERRQLTVVFCDLVGSTALSARLDPEDLHEVIAAYHHTAAGVVADFDGFVAKYMGDGVLAYFGYPRAHEDDPERAVRAGLSLIDAVCRLDIRSVKLQARVGIATGPVVIGDLIDTGFAREQSVVGEAPNLAARLQALARPNTVLIASSTRTLVRDLFDYRDLGTVEVKGFGQPVPAWRVLGPSAVASRFAALRGSAVTPLIGRDEEISLLLRRWSRVKNGYGQVVLVSGEPGFGKSRIAEALEESLEAELHFSQRLSCSPYRQNSPLHPFIEQLARAIGLVPNDPPAAKFEKFEFLLAGESISDEDTPFLADLLSLAGSERYPVPNLSPQRKKERTLEALIRRLASLSKQQPVTVIFEDVHWIDPTSHELLERIVRHIRTLPVLLIITCRPDFHPPWIGEANVTVLVLNRLGQHDTASMVKQIAGDKELPDHLITQIVERTDGVPLFVEELTKSILESGLLREEGCRYVRDAPLPPFAIPTSLQALLIARLDRLGSVRHIAQMGAAFGRWFRYTSLRAASRLPEDELQASLTRLIDAGLIFQSGLPPDALYTFKHTLVQEAVYGTLLRNNRRELHGRIAAALEAGFPQLIDSQPEVLARHYTEAGDVEKSVLCWGKSAQRSVAHSAMTEAVAQFQRALEQLTLLPDSVERQRRELEFSAALATALQSVKGYAAPEIGRVLDRARVLWEQLESPSEFLQVSYAQSLYHEIRGELDFAHRLDKDLLCLGQKRQDNAGLVLAHHSLGRNLMFAGRFASSRSHFEQSLTLCDETLDQSLVRQAGIHPQVASQAFLAITLFCLGYSNQALVRSTEAIARAQTLSHSPSLAVSLTNGARLAAFIGNDAMLEQSAEQLAAVATERSFSLWQAIGTVYGGWAKVKGGHFVEGISLLRNGLAAYRATQAEAWVPYQIYLLAGACEMSGKSDEAVDLLEEAIEVSDRTGERWLIPEIFRQKGQVLLRQGHPQAAEELYLKALDIAQMQEGQHWNLKAATSLSRLWMQQGRRQEARDILAPIYNWFTEGFDTADLREAKAVLDTLSAMPWSS